MSGAGGRSRRPSPVAPDGPASHAASTPGIIEEMEADSTLWEVRWLSFNQGADYDLVNAEIARVAQGWEPFATLTQPGGWVLLLKRPARDAR